VETPTPHKVEGWLGSVGCATTFALAGVLSFAATGVAGLAAAPGPYIRFGLCTHVGPF
jgi:hypothetical protein